MQWYVLSVRADFYTFSSFVPYFCVVKSTVIASHSISLSLSLSLYLSLTLTHTLSSDSHSYSHILPLPPTYLGMDELVCSYRAGVLCLYADGSSYGAAQYAPYNEKKVRSRTFEYTHHFMHVRMYAYMGCVISYIGFCICIIVRIIFWRRVVALLYLPIIY